MNSTLDSKLLSERPCLIDNCTVTPAIIRQEHWVLIKNSLNAKHVRLHRRLWCVVQELDGDVSLGEWIDRHASEFGDHRLLSTVMMLHRHGIVERMNAFSSPVPVTNRLLTQWNPLMIRVALFNPTRLLDSICMTNRLLGLHALIICWVTLVLMGIVAVVVSWPLLRAQVQLAGTAEQLVYLMLLYPLSKCLHELAHGWALRRLGGEVPEAGISFMVFFPLPYIDASDVWTLPRRHRMLVTAAGMAMDTLVSAIGIVLWLNLSAGVVADMVFLLVLIGVVSVLLFNANPLLKFDGYYILEDALNSPGLARRSVAYYRYLFKRHVFRVSNCLAPPIAYGERRWLLVYGVSSTLYRLFIAAVICVFLVTTLHELGVVLSLFSVVPLCVIPLWQFFRYLSTSAELQRSRRQAYVIVVCLVFSFTVFLFTVPLPSSTRTQGVVWVGSQAEIYAAQSGKVSALLVRNGAHVHENQLLMVLDSIDLPMEIAEKQAAVRLAELEVTRYQQLDPARARSAKIALVHAQFEAQRSLEQLEKLSVRAPVAGRVALSSPDVVPGASIEQGTLLAYVVNDTDRVIRAVLDQSSLGVVQQGIRNASIRLARNISESIAATVTRQTPSGSHELPSAALANTGFGGFKVHGDSEILQTLDKVFHLELNVSQRTDAMQQVPIGSRAFVTLQHPYEPLGYRWLRVSRQLFLKHLSV